MNLNVTKEWGRRVEAEYASAAITAELLHWLIQLGVSPDTLSECQGIVSDELLHAELSRDVFMAAGGSEDAIKVDGRKLHIPHVPNAPLLQRALWVCADFYCCGETVARPLFREMLRGATQEKAKSALARILKDEARHSAFGWTLFAELLERTGDDVKSLLPDQVAQFQERIAKGYGGELSAPQTTEVSEEERAWGLLSSTEYATLSKTALHELIEPRFQKLLSS